MYNHFFAFCKKSERKHERKKLFWVGKIVNGLFRNIILVVVGMFNFYWLFATEIIHYTDFENFIGVYKLGSHPFAVKKSTFIKKEGFVKYHVDFLLSENDDDLSFLVTESDQLFKIFSNEFYAFAIFKNKSGIFLFRIEKGKGAMRYDIDPTLTYQYIEPLDANLNSIGDLTIISKVEIEKDGRIENAYEIITIGALGKIILRQLDEQKDVDQKVYKSMYTSPNGILLLFDTGLNSKDRYYKLEQYQFSQMGVNSIILGDSKTIGNLLIESYEKGWIVCYADLIGPRWNLYSKGISLVHLTPELKVESKNIIPTQRFKDSIYSARVQKHPLGYSINNFIYNQELDIIFTHLMIQKDKIELLGESFNFGPGVTYAELSMGIRDTNETVLSIYDHVFFEFDVNGVLLESKIIEGENVNVLLEKRFTSSHPLKDFGLAEKSVETGLFKTVNFGNQYLTYLKYRELRPFLSQYHLKSKMSLSSQYIEFGYPCESLTYIDTLLETGDYPRLEKLNYFTKNIDTTYEKLYAKSESPAYKITNLNAMYPPDTRKKFTYLTLNKDIFFVYRYEWECNELEFKLIDFRN